MATSLLFRRSINPQMIGNFRYGRCFSTESPQASTPTPEQPTKEGAQTVDEVTEEVDEAMAVQLKHAEQKIKDLEDQLLRSYAERENIRKIGQNDMENTKKYAIRGFAKDLLDVADNLERALSNVKPEHIESIPQLKSVCYNFLYLFIILYVIFILI